MHVCMYACMTMRVCMYAVIPCMYAIFACMYVCMHACMHLCTYACMHVGIGIGIGIGIDVCIVYRPRSGAWVRKQRDKGFWLIVKTVLLGAHGFRDMYLAV